MAQDHKPKQPEVEPDDRFPSGPWIGFYLQPSVSGARFRMELQLTFRDSLVEGAGEDPIGPFRLRGRYDLKSGDVTLHKHYRTHHIFYKGCADGRNRGIWGLWEIKGLDRGGFHIWPEAAGRGDELDRHEQAPRPAEAVAPARR